MPRDHPAPSVPVLPAWLSPGLIDSLARGIETDFAAGVRHHLAVEHAFERARCAHPSLPSPTFGKRLPWHCGSPMRHLTSILVVVPTLDLLLRAFE